jgi:hypothetical protein
MITDKLAGRALLAGAVLTGLAAIQSAAAAVVIKYTFDNGTVGTKIESFATGTTNLERVLVNPGIAEIANNGGSPLLVNVSAWNTEAAGSLYTNAAEPNRIFTGLDPNVNQPDDGAIGGTGWQNGNAFIFRFDVAPGFVLGLDSFSFLQQRSSGGNGVGPSQWSLFVNGAGAAQANGTTGTAAQNGAFTGLDALQGTVTFRLFATGAAHNTTATWRVDNFTLHGHLTPVPLPPALLLLGGALGVLRVRGRRACSAARWPARMIMPHM